MAAAEEEARQKALKALREKTDMLIAIKERKAEGMLVKYYANDKYKEHVKERDPEGHLPIHWAGEAQCRQHVFEVLLAAYPEGIKELTNKTKERPGGDHTLHLLCKGIITAETEKAMRTKIEDKKGAIETLVQAYPGATKLRLKGKLPLHNAARSNTPPEGIVCLVDAYPEACQMAEEGDDIYGLGSADGNLPLHSACLKKLADGVVEKLVATYKEGAAVVNALGNLPIHYAAEKQCTQLVMQYLLGAFRDGTKAKDERGLIPLQLAAQYQALDEVVGELLRAYPDGARLKDKLGRYPVRIAFENQGSDGVIDQLLVTFPQAASEKARCPHPRRARTTRAAPRRQHHARGTTPAAPRARHHARGTTRPTPRARHHAPFAYICMFAHTRRGRSLTAAVCLAATACALSRSLAG